MDKNASLPVGPESSSGRQPRGYPHMRQGQVQGDNLVDNPTCGSSSGRQPSRQPHMQHGQARGDMMGDIRSDNLGDVAKRRRACGAKQCKACGAKRRFVTRAFLRFQPNVCIVAIRNCCKLQQLLVRTITVACANYDSRCLQCCLLPIRYCNTAYCLYSTAILPIAYTLLQYYLLHSRCLQYCLLPIRY